MEKFRLLTEDEIEVKVKQVVNDMGGKPKGVICLLYKTARVDMDMLDEVVGPENWESDYKEIKGNLYAGIGVRTAEGKPWVWKWDCGIESREDGEGNQKKGEASDAFKRAGFKWGIGRELYSSPFIYISADKVNFTKGGRTNDKFEVEKVKFASNRKCELLTIRNAKTGAVVFTYSDPPAHKYRCAVCGREFHDSTIGGKHWTAAQIFAECQRRNPDGVARCGDCAKKMKEAQADG